MEELFIPKAEVSPNWLIAIILCNLSLVAVLRVFFGKRLYLIFNAFFSNRFTDQLAREERSSSNVSNLLLDGIYILNLALFLYLGIKEFTNAFSSLSAGVLYFTLSLLVLAFIIAKWLFMFLFGWMFDFEETISLLLFQRFLTHSVAGIVLIPIVVISVFYNGNVRVVWYFMASLFVIMFLFRLLRIVFQVGVFKKMSVKYIILYICALEILPVLILTKLISNYM